MYLIHHIAGAFTHQPEELKSRISKKAADIIKRAFDDIDPKRQSVPNFDLFLRLMSERRYEGLLFADISAMTRYNRIGGPLTTILQREDLHARLVNGSDYPLPAVNLLIRTRALVQHGHITKDERAGPNEIHEYHPILF